MKIILLAILMIATIGIMAQEDSSSTSKSKWNKFKEKTKEKIDALDAKIAEKNNGEKKSIKDSKKDEKVAEVEKKVKTIDLGTFPEQNQVTTYFNSSFKKNKMDSVDVYSHKEGKWVKSNSKIGFYSTYDNKFLLEFNDGDLKFVPSSRREGTDKKIFYVFFRYSPGDNIIVSDRTLYRFSYSESKNEYRVGRVFGDVPPSSDIEVINASLNDHMKRANEAQTKAYKDYENSKFDLSSLKFEDIERVGLEYKKELDPIQEALKDYAPDFYVIMKDGTKHYSTHYNGLMSLSKQIKKDYMKFNSDSSAVTFSYTALHDPRIVFKQTFGEALSWDLEISQNGLNGYPADSRSRGDSKGDNGGGGANLIIGVKKKTSEEGEDYLSVRIEGLGKPKFKKLNINGSLTISANGGRGADGTKGKQADDELSYAGNGGDGGDGGNGGNVTLIVDPNVDNAGGWGYIPVSVEGAKGGAGGMRGVCFSCKGEGKSGSRGKDGVKGTFTFKVEKLDF